MDYLDITFATNPLILDTFLDDFAMDPIILDILLSDDATWSTGSDDGDEVFWTMVFVPFEMLAAFFLLVPVWYLIRAYWDNLLELPRLLATLVYWIWTMIYRSVNEQTQTANANMISLPVVFMKSEGKLGGVVASCAPWLPVEKQPQMVIFT